MKLNIPRKFSGRTEYQVLKNWYETPKFSFGNLNNISGNMVIVGRLLNGLEKNQLKMLKEWIFQEGNQLLCLPSWFEISLSSLFDLKIDLNIVSDDNLSLEDWDLSKLDYKVKTNLKQGIIDKNKNDSIFTVNYKRHKYSGLLTVTTLPLLDFKLLTKSEFLKAKLEQLLIVENISKKKVETKPIQTELSTISIYILLLAGAGIPLEEDLDKKLEKYLYKKFSQKEINNGENILDHRDLIKEGEITKKGKKLIKEKGYIPYIKEINKKKSDKLW
mgnify:CR=1 FL=1